MKGRILIFLLVSVSVFGFTPSVFSQEKYPDKPITIIVPFGPGGSSDLCFRSLTGELSKVLKVPVNVLNRTGAGGLVGSDAVATSKHDGYTLLGTSSAPLTVAPAIDPKISLELDPLAIVAYQVNILSTRNESEFKTLEDVVNHAKKRPGGLTSGTSGIQSEPYFALELFKSAAGINIRHVPIASSSEGITSTLGGHIDFWFGSLSTSYSLMKGGRIRGIAISGNRRLEEFPYIPTFAEKGFPQVNVNLIITMMGPKGLQPSVIKTLQDALRVVLENPEVIASLNKLNYTIDLQTDTEKLRKFLKEELERFTRIAKETGIRK